MGLMANPEMLGLLMSGVGQGLSSAGRGAAGQGFNTGNMVPQMMALMQQKKNKEKLAGLMQNMPGLTPQQQGVLGAMDPQKAIGILAGQQFPQGGQPAVWQQKRDEMMRMGVPEHVASGIATGRYMVSLDPVSRERVVVDIASGAPVPTGPAAAPPQGGGYAPAGGGPAAPPPIATAPATEAPAAVPESTPRFDKAFGAEGWFKNAANTIGDFVGAGQLYPDEATARRQIENLNAQTSTLLAEGTDTRGGKYLIDRFDAIIPKPGGLQGPEDAVKTLREVRDMLSRARDIDQRTIAGNVSPTEKSNAQASVYRLSPMIEEYDSIIREFEKQYFGTQAPTTPAAGAPDGVDPDLWQFMTPEERALWEN